MLPGWTSFGAGGAVCAMQVTASARPQTSRMRIILVMSSIVGLLVHGDNHFIVAGPEPDDAIAVRLAHHWSLIRIGSATPPDLAQWTIRNKEFRENLAWAV